jgi:hypothetical protein
MPFALEIALDADAATIVRTAWRPSPTSRCTTCRRVATDTSTRTASGRRAAWVPHCTLAQDIEGAGRLTRAELVRFRPVHYLTAVPLMPSR